MTRACLFITTVLCAGLAGAGLAQDMRERAGDALSGVDRGGDILTREDMEETVLTFETDTPEESELEAHEIEEAIIEEQASGSDASQAHAASVASALTRQDVEVSPEDLSLADSSVASSEALLGALFSDATSCESGFDGERYFAEPICTSILGSVIQGCSLERLIDVDRRDEWRCETQNLEYQAQCDGPVTWSCSGTSGASCTTSGIWARGATLGWGSGANSFGLRVPAREEPGCSLISDQIDLSVLDTVNLTRLDLRRIEWAGTAQVLVNGTPVWTSTGHNGLELTLDKRDCGKRCSRDAAFVGGQWVEDCHGEQASDSPEIDILGLMDFERPGPSFETGTEITLTTGTVSVNSIELRRVVRDDPVQMRAVFRQRSSCCTAFEASVGEACQ